MDISIYDRITALKYQYEQIYSNHINLIKKICFILFRYDNMSQENIKKYMVNYNEIYPFNNLTTPEILNIISSINFNPIQYYFTFNTVPTVNTQEDVKLVLEEEELEKIQIKKYKDIDEKLKKENPKCMIKLEDFKDDDEIRILPCNHFFTKEHIDNWLLETSYKCPICRNSCGKYTSKI